MKKIHLNVQKEFCGECSLALMHFIGKTEGVDSITAEDGRVAISFDDTKVTEEFLLRITKENIEKLGYKMTEGE